MARILVIEDEASIRSNLVRFIGLEGHEAIEATNGRSGLQAAQAVTPDLIFCDVMMPFMTGMEVLAAIQLDATLRQVPFIFFRPVQSRSGLRRPCAWARMAMSPSLSTSRSSAR